MEAGCTTSGNKVFPIPVFDAVGVEGIAFYDRVWPNPAFRSWNLFRYKVDGFPLGDQNNVIISLYEGSTLKMELESPDDRKGGVWYDVRPAGLRRAVVSQGFVVLA